MTESCRCLEAFSVFRLGMHIPSLEMHIFSLEMEAGDTELFGMRRNVFPGRKRLDCLFLAKRVFFTIKIGGSFVL